MLGEGSFLAAESNPTKFLLSGTETPVIINPTGGHRAQVCFPPVPVTPNLFHFFPLTSLEIDEQQEGRAEPSRPVECCFDLLFLSRDLPDAS